MHTAAPAAAATAAAAADGQQQAAARGPPATADAAAVDDAVLPWRQPRTLPRSRRGAGAAHVRHVQRVTQALA